MENKLEDKVYTLCKRDYTQELVNRGYNNKQAEEYINKFGVPKGMIEVYRKVKYE